jgi:hypothetical protein
LQDLYWDEVLVPSFTAHVHDGSILNIRHSFMY